MTKYIKLTELFCFESSEETGDELYITVTPEGGRPARYDITRDADDGTDFTLNIVFPLTSNLRVSLWDEDFAGGDERLGFFDVKSTATRDGIEAFQGYGSSYTMHYDIFTQ